MEKINLIDVGCADFLIKPWIYNTKKINYILGFDPLNIYKYKKRLDKYKIKNDIYKLAVWHEEIEKSIYRCKKAQNSSFFEPDYLVLKENGLLDKIQKKKRKRFNVLEEIKVDCVRLDRIIENSKVNFDFIKIDTQGSELNVLKSMGDYLSSQIVGVHLEMHFKEIYKEIPLSDKINIFLEEKGFFNYTKINESDRNSVGRDFLYLRNDKKKEKQLGLIKRVYSL